MPTLQLLLLGALDVRCDDQPLPKPPTLKSQSLLAYLATHRRQPQSRERLADLFWGDRLERRARSSLSTALWHIRRCFPDGEPILSGPHSVQFDPACDLWFDCEAFESYISGEDTASLEAGLVLYRGDFMEGRYDDWILDYRYRRAFRPGLPEAMCLQGTYEWLRGKPAAAPKWWQRSLLLAEEMGQRYGIGMTHLEMGRRLGERAHSERAEAILAETGAEWDLAQAREAIEGMS